MYLSSLSTSYHSSPVSGWPKQQRVRPLRRLRQGLQSASPTEHPQHHDPAGQRRSRCAGPAVLRGVRQPLLAQRREPAATPTVRARPGAAAAPIQRGAERRRPPSLQTAHVSDDAVHHVSAGDREARHPGDACIILTAPP